MTLIRKSLAFILLIIGMLTAAADSNALPAVPGASFASVPSGSGNEVVFDSQASAEPLTYYYLAEWVWKSELDSVDSYWGVADAENAIGTIDLRTRIQMAQQGGESQCCQLVGYSVIQTPTPELIYLGTNIDSGILNIVDVEQQLNYGIFTRRTIAGIVRELLGEKSDPTGQTAPKPLMPNGKRVIKANIGDIRLFTDRLPTDSIEWIKAMSVLQDEYNRIKFSDLNLALKVAGYWERKYGFDIRTDIQKLDGLTNPETTVSDDFNRSNEQLDASANWTTIDGIASSMNIISSTIVERTDSEPLTAVRYDGTALSSDDMYAEADITALSGTIVSGGIATRVNDGSGGGDYYYGQVRHHFSQGDTWIIFKVVNGTRTDISAGGLTESVTPPYTLRLESDGSDHELFKDGVSKVAVIGDSSITGNNYGGLVGQETFSTRNIRYDNYEAADLAVAAPRRVFIFQN